ncbi:hypothetical protein COLO4_23608 [Corchorus olitorius]|uniref:Uncharacterized protein n=1 Tax=Corchorus olitorius TaxID=93759 RepID=A0A1R3IFS7_9ROSI|nr:hypothetical protein COLO4_23608 [Corchorus olitorius]
MAELMEGWSVVERAKESSQRQLKPKGSNELSRYRSGVHAGVVDDGGK